MSRSFKKNLIVSCTGRRYRAYAKNQANRKIRRYLEEISDGKSYRKVYESWDITDFSSRWYPEYKDFWSQFKARMK